MAKPSAADVMRLGSDVAGVKAQTKPSQWRALVRSAHAKGFTVSGALSGAPDALKARTQSSLVQQAKTTVATAYDPLSRQLNADEQTTRNLASKRAADEQSFAAWLASQREKMRVDNIAADQQLQTNRQSLVDQATAAQQATLAHAQAAMPAGATALGQVQQAADLGNRQAINQAQTGANLSVAHGELSQAIDQSSTQQAAAAAASRWADTFKALDGIRQQRDQLASDRGKALSDEVSRLNQNEQTKADANRNFDAAAQKLGVDQQKLDAQVLNQNRQYGLAKDKFNLDTWMAKHQAKVDDAKVQLGYDQIASREGVAAANRALRTKLAKEAGAPGGIKLTATDRKQAATNYQTVETIKQQIIDLHNDPRFHNGVSKAGSTIRQVLAKRGFSNPMIDIGEDLRKHGGKLSKAGRDKARAIGIPNPQDYWGVA